MVRTQIESVISRVLRDEIDLFDAIGDERLGFGDDVLLRAAAMRTAHPRDDAEAAWMIATLGNFQVGEMPRRDAQSRTIRKWS